jgi:hypothetical protein
MAKYKATSLTLTSFCLYRTPRLNLLCNQLQVSRRGRPTSPLLLSTSHFDANNDNSANRSISTQRTDACTVNTLPKTKITDRGPSNHIQRRAYTYQIPNGLGHKTQYLGSVDQLPTSHFSVIYSNNEHSYRQTTHISRQSFAPQNRQHTLEKLSKGSHAFHEGGSENPKK